MATPSGNSITSPPPVLETITLTAKSDCSFRYQVEVHHGERIITTENLTPTEVRESLRGTNQFGNLPTPSMAHILNANDREQRRNIGRDMQDSLNAADALRLSLFHRTNCGEPNNFQSANPLAHLYNASVEVNAFFPENAGIVMPRETIRILLTALYLEAENIARTTLASNTNKSSANHDWQNAYFFQGGIKRLESIIGSYSNANEFYELLAAIKLCHATIHPRDNRVSETGLNATAQVIYDLRQHSISDRKIAYIIDLLPELIREKVKQDFIMLDPEKTATAYIKQAGIFEDSSAAVGIRESIRSHIDVFNTFVDTYEHY